MAGSSSFVLKSGTQVASKYRVGERLPGDLSRPAYAGTAAGTEQPVTMFVVTAREATALKPAVGLEHAHLVKVLALEEREDGDAVLVCERVEGATMSQVLAERGSLSPVEAVGSVLRVADALATLHGAGAVHGLLRPGSVLCGVEGRATPLLAYAPPLDQSSPYRSSERGSSGPPSTADDTWALAGLLHELLIGKPPPSTGVQAPDELSELGLADEALQAVLAHGLATSSRHRTSDVTAVKRELARWYVDHAGDEKLPLRGASQAPPPLPSAPQPESSTAPSELQKTVQSATAPAVRRPRWWLWVAAVALPLGAGASWGVASLLSAKEVVVEVPRPSSSAAASASASASSIDLSEVPLTGESDLATGDPMATCVAAYLPKGAFPTKVPELDWVCDVQDAREGAKRLRSAVVKGASGRLTDAMKIMGKLGWYQMAAYSIVYAGCCADAKPLELPDPSEGCPAMAAPLAKLGAAVVAERDYAPALESFQKAISCEVEAKRAKDFRQRGKPKSAEEAAFQDLVAALRAGP